MHTFSAHGNAICYHSPQICNFVVSSRWWELHREIYLCWFGVRTYKKYIYKVKSC